MHNFKKRNLQGKLLKAINILNRKKGILRNHVIASFALILTSILTLFLLTGVLYFRNEVTIIDGEKSYITFTMFSEASEILDEQGIKLENLDYYAFSGFDEKNQTAELEIKRTLNILIRHDGIIDELQLPSDTSVREALECAKITLSDEDIVKPEREDILASSGQIEVIRAFDVEIIDGKEKITVKTSGETVSEILEKRNITLNEEDIISHDLMFKVTEPIEIKISRITYRDRVIVEAIPFKTIEKQSTLHVIGESEVVSEGITGSVQIETREKLVDGEVVDTVELSRAVTNEPVDEVIVKGTALATPYSKREFDEIVLLNGLPTEYSYIVSGKSCAYTAGPKAGTASGRKLQIGTIAVDPNIIPYGSLVYIVSQDGKTVYGAAVTADTGYLTDVVADLYMGLTSEHYDDACNWGAKYVDIYVINTGLY